MKNLLITGASQGIGKATALEAAKKGMFIGINYNSNDKAAEETLSEVKELGGEGVILKCDVSKNSAVKDMFENFVDNAGSLDGVFNNAGTTGPVSKTVSYTHLRAHETGAYLVCRLLLEKKKKLKEAQSQFLETV